MIPRPFTCCCAVLAIASGFFLYTKKHQTTLLDQQISSIVHETEHVRAQTAMLRTEWALENQPERLSALVSKHAAYLQSMEPAQFVRMADLVQHLPNVTKDAAPAASGTVQAVAQAGGKVIAPPAAVAAVAAPVAIAQAVVATPHMAPPEPEHERAATVADATPPRPLPVRTVRPHPMVVAMNNPAPSVAHVLVAPTPAQPTAVHDAPVVRTASVAHRQPLQAAETAVRPTRQTVSVASADDAETATTRHVAPAASSRADAMAPRRLAQNSDDATPVRHPLPVAAASWHPVRQHRAPLNEGYMEARATSGYTNGSLLSRGSDALPAPVPVTN
ncbi:cell division protein FtsL [Acetobacter syzygii]|uniref:Uncharacterized protein n=1 Tax=Acetobacter syzygii TaxID=146476 RepID=A0A270BR47_9PROT|nr:hypothetical protein [Acetobacter syzygii]PAL27211.1 hypothetical protein B9K05_04370 [Acetobacter syzygii]PAL27787.1 hypothetical protein B9K04_03150 [Acetobacter syzygii]